MTTFLQITTTFIATFILACNCESDSTNSTTLKDHSVAVSPKASVLIDTPKSFVKNYGVADNNPLFVFVGEKVHVEQLPNQRGSMDKAFKAKYAVLDKVYGHFPGDTIEFVAYDHYGTPDFSRFKNVLLYVSADSGMYYHQKYMYNDVYRTKDGRWAGTYAWNDYRHEYNKKTKIKPVKMDFAEPVFYPTKLVDERGNTLTRTLPKPYFSTIRDRAIAVYGNYVDDLFRLKRDGYLTARQIFKNGKIIR
jgi:hypothetical protein